MFSGLKMEIQAANTKKQINEKCDALRQANHPNSKQNVKSLHF